MHQDDAVCYSSKLKLYARIFSSETQSAVCYINVLISSSKTQSVLQTSPDAINWTAADIGTSDIIFWKSVFWSTRHDTFIAIGDVKGYWPPDEKILSSSDGIIWTKIYNSTTMYSILFNEIQYLNKTTDKLEKTVEELNTTVAELKEMMTQMFYAPGMPGYLAAQSDFENLSIKK